MKIINYLKSLLVMFFIIFTLSLIATMLHYYNILGIKGLGYFKIIVPIISIIFGGFVLGRRSKTRGFLEGLKLGGLYLVIMTILSLLVFKNTFNIRILLYDLILLLSGMLGSMIGINFKIKELSI